MAPTGGLDHGRKHRPQVLAAMLEQAGLPHELLDADEATERYPGMVFDGPVLHHPQAGTVDARRSVHAFLDSARSLGARDISGTAVRRLTLRDDAAVVHTTAGDVRARRVVVAAGSWLEELVGGLVALPAIRVTEQQVFHFTPRDAATSWPVTLHHDNLNVYHLPGGSDAGPARGRKVAEHAGQVTTAKTRNGIVDEAHRSRMVDYVERWLPGLDPTPYAETTCLYTSTSSEDFLLDRIGPLVVVSACSGHGAKMAPVVGRIAADLVSGKHQQIARFTFRAHHT